jgi:DDE superfamily endonuclease
MSSRVTTDRPFPGIPVHYRSNGQGWLTASILRDWLVWFDSTLDRAVLLVSSLFTKTDLDMVTLHWVTVVPVSAWTRGSSTRNDRSPDTHCGVCTPMDSVLLDIFRGRYRQATLARAIGHMSNGKYIGPWTMRSVAEVVLSSWHGINASVVKHAFRVSPICPPVLAARARHLTARSDVQDTTLQKLKIDLERSIGEYARLARGYMFARDIGWNPANIPPEWAQAEQYITIDSEREVLHAGATDAELLMSVSPSSDENSETGTGEFLPLDNVRTDDNNQASVGTSDRNATGAGEPSTRRLRVDFGLQRELNSREEAKQSLEMLLRFFRKDSELHTEEVIYNSSALLVAITNAIRAENSGSP